MNEITIQVRVSDYEKGLEWYQTLLQRKPDFTPHEGFAEWELIPGCWLQMAEGEPAEESGPIRIGVGDIEFERDRVMKELNVDYFEIYSRDEVPARWATFYDPWRNRIGFFENLGNPSTISFTTSLKDVSPEMLTKGFFVGWPQPPSPQKHYETLKNSYKIVLSVDKSKNQVVGFINAISDGVLAAYVPLLEVLPEYQNQGIGKKLVLRMLDELKDIYMVDLICDEELQSYYERMGMAKAKGMILRNYKYQSGRLT